MQTPNNKQLNDDYCDFVTAKADHSESEMREMVVQYVKSDLRRNHLRIFSKLVMVQVVMGMLTLLFCPQFELSLTNNYELFHYFHHRYGTDICALICGVIFTAPSATFAAYLLDNNDAQTIKTAGIRYHLAIILLSLFVFQLLGADLFNYTTLLWFVAACLAARLAFVFNLHLRPQPHHKF